MDKERLRQAIPNSSLQTQFKIFRPAAVGGTILTYEGLETLYQIFNSLKTPVFTIGPIFIENPYEVAAIGLVAGGFLFWSSIPPRVSD